MSHVLYQVVPPPEATGVEHGTKVVRVIVSVTVVTCGGGLSEGVGWGFGPGPGPGPPPPVDIGGSEVTCPVGSGGLG